MKKLFYLLALLVSLSLLADDDVLDYLNRYHQLTITAGSATGCYGLGINCQAPGSSTNAIFFGLNHGLKGYGEEAFGSGAQMTGVFSQSYGLNNNDQGYSSSILMGIGTQSHGYETWNLGDDAGSYDYSMIIHAPQYTGSFCFSNWSSGNAFTWDLTNGLAVWSNYVLVWTSRTNSGGYSSSSGSFTNVTISNTNNPGIVSFWGDSRTYGTGSVYSYPFYTYFYDSNVLAYTNNGVSGYTTLQIRTQFMVMPTQWSNTAIIWAGYNDNVYSGITSNYNAPVITNIQAMIASLKDTNRYLVLTVPSSVGYTNNAAETTWFAQLNAAIRTNFVGHVVDVVAWASNYTTGNANDGNCVSNQCFPFAMYYSDGIHFVDNGYQFVGSNVANIFNSLLANYPAQDNMLSPRNLNSLEGVISGNPTNLTVTAPTEALQIDTPYGGYGQFQNLLTNSMFLNSGAGWWYLGGADYTLTFSQFGPDNTTNAVLVTQNTTAYNQYFSQSFTSSAATNYCFSVWLKAGTTNMATIDIYDTTGGFSINGVTNILLTNVWQRFYVTGSNATAGHNIQGVVSVGSFYGTANSSIYTYGFQCEVATNPGVYAATGLGQTFVTRQSGQEVNGALTATGNVTLPGTTTANQLTVTGTVTSTNLSANYQSSSSYLSNWVSFLTGNAGPGFLTNSGSTTTPVWGWAQAPTGGGGITPTTINTSTGQVTYIITAPALLIKTNAAYNLVLQANGTSQTVIGNNIWVDITQIGTNFWSRY